MLVDLGESGLQQAGSSWPMPPVLPRPSNHNFTLFIDRKEGFNQERRRHGGGWTDQAGLSPEGLFHQNDDLFHFLGSRGPLKPVEIDRVEGTGEAEDGGNLS